MFVEFELKIEKETSEEMMQIPYKKFVSGILYLAIAPILQSTLLNTYWINFIRFLLQFIGYVQKKKIEVFKEYHRLFNEV